MAEHLLAVSRGAFEFPNLDLIEAACRRWPGAETSRPPGGLAGLVEAWLYPPSDVRPPEIEFTGNGQSIAIEAAPDTAAAITEWICRTAPMPATAQWSSSNGPTTRFR